MEKLLKEMGPGVKSIIGGITGNKKKKNFFSKSGGEVV